MKTIIHSNGSKWAGEKPDSVETLEKMIRTYPLDKRFENTGNFAYRKRGVFFNNRELR